MDKTNQYQNLYLQIKSFAECPERRKYSHQDLLRNKKNNFDNTQIGKKNIGIKGVLIALNTVNEKKEKGDFF